MEVKDIGDRLLRLEQDILPRLCYLEQVVAQLQQQPPHTPTPYGVHNLQTPTYYSDSFQIPAAFQTPTRYCESLPQMLHPSSQPLQSLSQPHPVQQSLPQPLPQPLPQSPLQPNVQSQLQPSTPKCIPLQSKVNTNCLPSSQIDKTKLKPAEEVVAKYRTLRGESKAGKLAVRLAKESFFGEDVLAKCTVGGRRDLPALPVDELNELKQTMFLQFPNYWPTPQEFEGVWSTITEAIGQAAKGLRKKGVALQQESD